MAFPFIKLTMWARVLVELLPFPKWQVAEEVRLWVLKCLVVADKLADETVTDVDDAIVAAFRTLAIDEYKWLTYYGLLLRIFNQGSDVLVTQTARIEEVAGQLGMEVSVLTQLITWNLSIIEKFRN